RDQLVAFGRRQVGDEAVRKVALRPRRDPVPAQGRIAARLGSGTLRYEEIEQVLAPAIHERRRRLTGEDVEATADERETAIGEVVSGHGEVEEARETGLDCVLYARSNVN